MDTIPCGTGVLYTKENYLYKCNTTKHGVKYLRCSNTVCPSRGTYQDGNEFHPSIHNHPPDEVDIELRRLRVEIKAEALNSRLNPREIFDAVCQRYPRAAVRLGYPSIRSSIYRHRQMGLPPMPHSLVDFSAILQREEWLHLRRDRDDQPFFRGLIGSEEEGWFAAIYMSQKMTNALRRTERLHLDATFKTVPAELHAHQLLTIHGEYMHHLFPLAYAIMSRKTQSAYEGVLSYLKEHTPELNPTVVMSDFEQAMQNAARMVWPNTRIVGCFFHYAQQAEAEQLSQRQMAYLARVAVNADDAVAGEGDLVCVACAVHKRSYMTQPCAHFVLCGTCVLVHRRTVNYRGVLPQPIICPVCRSPLTGYCRVFQ